MAFLGVGSRRRATWLFPCYNGDARGIVPPPIASLASLEPNVAMKAISTRILSSLAASLLAASAGAYTYTVVTDHTNCLYRCGETATFTVTVMETNGVPATAGTLSAKVDNFGPAVQAKTDIDLSKENPFRVSGTLEEPGFLRLELPRADKGMNHFGVAFEPERIVKGSPRPEDFDEFWDNAVKTLDETVPLDPELKLLKERCTDKFQFYRVSFASVDGTRVYGYLSIPNDASADKKYPVRFQVPAAGNGKASWTVNMKGADDAISMMMTVHPYEPQFDLEKNDKLFKANEARLGRGYSSAGMDGERREDYYFYRALLGINRAVNWLAERPEVDLSSFTYSGTSQGGGFGFYLLGLNRHFTKGALFVPALTDTMGYLKGRVSGWPRPVEAFKANEEKRAAAERNAPYFDGANFATRITCPVRVAVGFSDTTCPPCAVYAAYNAIPVEDKAIAHGIWMGHGCFGEFYRTFGAWQKEH